jgi:hypothetical protein
MKKLFLLLPLLGATWAPASPPAKNAAIVGLCRFDWRRAVLPDSPRSGRSPNGFTRLSIADDFPELRRQDSTVGA